MASNQQAVSKHWMSLYTSLSLLYFSELLCVSCADISGVFSGGGPSCHGPPRRKKKIFGSIFMYFWLRLSRFLASQVLLNLIVTLRQCKACSLPTISAPVNLSPHWWRWCLVCTTHTVPRTAPAAVGPLLLLLLAGFTPTGATGMSHLVNPGCWHDRRDGCVAGCLSCKLQYIGIYTPKSVHVKLLLIIFLLPMSQEHQLHQWLLSLYPVGAAWAQWKIGGKKFFS